jgi:nucleoside-diphosphate-sugar epimerase
MWEMFYEFEKPFVVDSGKAERLLGLKPTPVKQAVAETVAWFKAHPRK